MRDIVYRPVRRRPSQASLPTPNSHPVIRRPTPPQAVDLWLQRLNQWGGSIVAMLGGEKPPTEAEYARVAIPTAPQKYRATSTQKKWLKEKINHTGKIVFDTTKQTTATTGKHLKTPVGKLALVHTLALLALFTFVVKSQEQPNTSQAARNSGEALAQPLQRYLPVIPNSPASEAFSETAAVQAAHKTPFHVWVTPWNMGEVNDTNAPYSSYSAFWGTVDSDGFTLVAKAPYTNWGTFAAENVGDKPSFLTLTGHPNATYLTLSSSESQQKFTQNVLDLVKNYNFTGVDIDFEGLGYENRDLFTSFIRNLAAALHAEGKQLAVTVEARIANQVPMDWYSLGIIADEIRVMAYDYHARMTGQPGPVSPLGWVKEVVDYAVQVIDPKKVVIGLGNYGYDWEAPTAPEESWNGLGLSHARALALAEEYKSPIIRSTGIDDRGYDRGNIPMFTYTDTNGKEHSVWFEDNISLQEKLNLLDQYALKGAIFWSVGVGDQEFWTQQNSSRYTE